MRNLFLISILTLGSFAHASSNLINCTCFLQTNAGTRSVSLKFINNGSTQNIQLGNIGRYKAYIQYLGTEIGRVAITLQNANGDSKQVSGQITTGLSYTEFSKSGGLLTIGCQ